jgi:NF-kappa-B inhibitor-like protein 1
LREDKARAFVSPASASASFVAAAEAIAAAEQAAAARRSAREGGEALRREAAAAAENAARSVAEEGDSEAEWSRFEVWAATAECVRLQDVPWPDAWLAEAAALGEDKPFAAQQTGVARSTAELRALQARWHPDRWMGRFGARVRPEEREAVLQRVTAVAARLNALVRDSRGDNR